MQRKVFNVWGRQANSPEEANARAEKALADNPKITNLHIAIIPYQHHYSFLNTTETKYRYQARWYDRKVARKLGKEASKAAPKHVCNCSHCEL